MKRALFFFPYFLTNIMATLFFVVWCFLLKDSYLDSRLKTTLYLFSCLFFSLLIFSVPRFLIRGVVPKPFQKGVGHGIWFITKIGFLWAASFVLLTLFKGGEKLISLYQVSLTLSFLLAIYSHYFWDTGFKHK